MKTIMYLTLLGLFALSAWNDPYSKLQWLSKLKDDHIEVFKSNAQKNQTAFKFVADLQAEREEIVTYLFDIEMMRAKFPMCSTFEVLEQSDNEYTFYIVLDFPRPIRDRDMVVKVKLEQGKDGRQLIITEGIPHYREKEPKLVRIPVLESRTILKVAEDHASVIQYSKFDLGGTVPKFLVDMIIPKQIQLSFYKMKSALESRI